MLARVPRSATIEVALTTQPNATARGRVREVSPQADPETGTFRVRVGLENPPTEMRLGSIVTGRTVIPRRGGVVIPSSALTRTQGQPAVWVVDPAASTVSLRPVEIMQHEQSEVVVEAGLTSGDVVVTAGVQSLRPGQRVRLLGEAS
jgi:RND family efflux transporter MFP subunit